MIDQVEACQSDEAALKGLFLGPQAENQEWVSSQIQTLLQSWFRWRQEFRPEDGKAISSEDMKTSDYLQRRKHMESMLASLAQRFEGEIPKFSPRYIGHMFSETSLPALFGHILTLLHNPNNISGESSRVGILIEEEAIGALGQMLGFSSGVGHFTSGGTIANFEAVYRARARSHLWMAAGLASSRKSLFESAALGWSGYDKISAEVHAQAPQWNVLEGNPFAVAAKIQERTGRVYQGPVILVPEHKHYSWTKAVNVFGLGAEAFWPVQLDHAGHLDVHSLKEQILRAHQEDRPVMMIISVLGTTELGMVDPIHHVQELLQSFERERGWHFWHHIDAAYGGFLCSLRGTDKTIRDVLSTRSLQAIEAVGRASSVTIDPHKLGYVPYSSGAFIAADERNYFQRAFGAPYVNFSNQKDKGPFTLEGSRSAAGAVATWMSAQCVGLSQEGYGRIIARTIRLRQELEEQLKNHIQGIRLAPAVDSNLLGFCIAHEGETLSEVNQRTLQLYESYNQGEQSEFFISKTKLYRHSYEKYFDAFVKPWGGRMDCDELVLIRLCIMNPFFRTIEMKVDMQNLFIESLKKRILALPK